jgi:hypothetical protein
MPSATLEILTLIAILVGPIVALAIQRWSDNRKEARDRKLAVFKTLMMHRATPVSIPYVQALNLIDVEFTENSEKEKIVRTAWKILLDHLNDADKDAATWVEKSRDFTSDLLAKMGNCLGYEFDSVHLKKHAYYPVGLGNIEEEQHQLRRKILDLLDGERRIPVAVLEEKFPELTADAASNSQT